GSVPIGAGAGRWVTVAAERTLLAVARTVTSTGRVLDAVQLLRDDPRVQVVFTVNDTSPFSAGVSELLQRAGARVIPWNRLSESRFDAAVTASENTELQAIEAPVLVLQHGVGFHKDLPNSRGDGRRLAGTVRAADLRGRRVLIAVTHPQQAAQLAEADPEVSANAVLIADPMVDRMRAARLLRRRYRAALGLGDRRLVVVSSTWGRQSLIGRWPDLPARLLAALNADTHRVATVLHPNVTAGHGGLQLRLWLAAARDGGLLMVPPDAGWQAMLAAADCVVGDHSSMSLLAAAAGVPLLLAPLADEVVPGTPMTSLSRSARRLDVRLPLAAQVEEAISTYRPGRYAEAVEGTFAAARPLRGVLYELLGLPEPDEPAPLVAWPPPVPTRVEVCSFVVRTRVRDDGVEVSRFPAAVRRHVAAPADGWTGHLSVGDDEWDLRMLQNAEVLTRAATSAESEAWEWTSTVLREFAGSTMACAGTVNGCVATFRDGRRVTAESDSPDVVTLAACLHALARGRRLANGDWRVRTARGEARVVVRLRGEA
ncbi:hypothetical protein ACIA8K_27630, partial [Catenuloplanes sp. NPDC051500]|uniref:hypothetical protein n=1 Tax=Catenuloplanes sp. NPDC051500 TaxID=3363959 RepID=UPI003795CB39